MKARSGDHPDESDTDEGEADTTDGATAGTQGTAGTSSTWETSMTKATEKSDAGSVRRDDDAASVASSLKDDAGSVRSGFTGMSLGSIGSVGGGGRRHKRKERWRNVRLPEEYKKLGEKREKGTRPPNLTDEQADAMPHDRPWMQYEVVGLHPGSVHTFRVKVRNIKGWSEYSVTGRECGVTPDVPMIPFDVVATPLSPFSMLVRWKSPHHNGSPLQYYHLQSCRMRFCDDENDSDSDLERCPGGVDEEGREERLRMVEEGAAMPVRDRDPMVDPWQNVPVSEWIARRFGSKIPRLLNLVSAGDNLKAVEDEDSDLETPREHYKMSEDHLDEFDVNVPKSAEELGELEKWALAFQHKLMTQGVESKEGGDDDGLTQTQTLRFDDGGDEEGDEEKTKQRRRVELLVGPRIPLSHGKQLAWLVGDLRPGTWHAFRISAGNAVGESFGCTPTAFARTYGGWRHTHTHALLPCCVSMRGGRGA